MAKLDKYTVQNADLQSFLGKTVDKFTWLWYTNLVKKTWQDVRTYKIINSKNDMEENTMEKEKILEMSRKENKNKDIAEL